MARKSTPTTPPATPPAAGGPSSRVLLSGLALAVGLGLVAGWLRYWLGFFTLAQGAGAGLLLAWLIKRAARAGGGEPAWHPGFRPALLAAGAWFAAFMVGQALGFGLAQPWFEPLGWLARIWEGRTVEPSFAVAATGPVHRAFVGGANQGLWLLLNAVDWLIMYFFLLAMPWEQRPRAKRARAAAPEGGS